MLPDNLGYTFDQPLKLAPHSPAILQDELVITYEELDQRSNRAANLMVGLGVSAGDRVAVLFNNDYRFLECMLGAMRLGAIPVPLNTRMSDEALANVIADCSPKALIAGPDMGERALSIVHRGPPMP